ncbi:MAG: hypothetical protein LBQ15_05605 [Clostridium sp.]|jgi:hypothetical protein|nr:hypothetical protein [Clostridium sp.]
MEIKDQKDLDEKTIIMEQNRLAKERKRKKNRKKKLIAGAVLLCLAAGGGGYFLWSRNTVPVEETVSIRLEDGQEAVFAMLVDVKGNEITYRVAEEVPAAESDGTADEERTAAQGGSEGTAEQEARRRPEQEIDGETGEIPEGRMSFGEGEAPQGGINFGEGDAPQGRMSFGEGEAPEGGINFGEGDAPQGRMSFGEGELPGRAESAGAQDTFVYEGTAYRLTEQTVTTLIPVGTEVITRLGAVTTFSRLQTGDYLILVMEKDAEEQVVAAIYQFN